ncbi:sulfotransferase family protein [Thetidibacter halocola]|uniref:Sulfotransferase n=1 Tax=Thetidibacter halocola TaxID=2827239 RepID=A0A8J7WI39_9RHOB|nr:sulfotransferase family protein [Thetidibacter halocola]MBS0125518.1 sulfotransferase [Thetidibacter halocola]
MLPLARPDLPARVARAKALYDAQDFDAARDAFAAVLKAAPRHAESLIFLSHIAFETGDAEGCLSALDQAVALLPDSAKARMLLAQRCGQLGQPDRALAAYDAAIALAPREIGAQADKAHYLQTLGRFDEAEALFRKLIRKHPNEGSLYRMFLATKKLPKGDPLLRQMQKAWADKTLPDGARMELGFALAKAAEDAGDLDRVFPLLNRANAIQAKLAPHDRAAREAEWRAFLDAQDGADLTPPDDPAPLRPVFVVGMPRSGTTLVEQIVASHDTARAGGEMGHALRLAFRHFVKGGRVTPLRDLGRADLVHYAADYLGLARRDTQATAGVITDKSIQTHMIFGLVRRALPGARIVIVHRDPRDIALSIYKTPFRLGTHRYSNDLADIADEIKRFRRSVAHWRDRMPGALHEVRYEDLVADPEPRARALIAAAGLDWQDACLSFHERGGAVRTLSVAQVRQPIHAGRREAWRKFEAQLQPFIDAWGDEPWD